MIPLNKQTYRKKMMTSRWDAALYDSRLGFVSGFGENLVDVLEPKPGERILDIGCGSGDLAARIAETGATVIGIDASPEMIAAARDKYGDRKEIEFHVAGAESFSIGEQVDAAFSNAALHWVKDARGAAASIWSAVRPGGRFVAEFGGKGNIATIVRETERVLSEHYGIDAGARNPWYFPSIAGYTAILEAAGWEVCLAHLYERPTTLEGCDGMYTWLTMFGGVYFAGMPEADAERAKGDICEALARLLFDPSTRSWTADYRRLRILAHKPSDARS